MALPGPAVRVGDTVVIAGLRKVELNYKVHVAEGKANLEHKRYEN